MLTLNLSPRLHYNPKQYPLQVHPAIFAPVITSLVDNQQPLNLYIDPLLCYH